MTTLPEIAACPNPECCGECAVTDVSEYERYRYSVICDDNLCGYVGPGAETEAEAIRLHNIICTHPHNGLCEECDDSFPRPTPSEAAKAAAEAAVAEILAEAKLVIPPDPSKWNSPIGDQGIDDKRMVEIILKHCQHLAQAAEWIPCSERMPTDEEQKMGVLVAVSSPSFYSEEHGDPDEQWVYHAHFQSDGMWHEVPRDDPFTADMTVTHWMPLPSAPSPQEKHS